MTKHNVEIYVEYRCKKGHTWAKYWRKWPWFGDFHMCCGKCGTRTWYCYKYDNSGTEALKRHKW